MKTIKYIAILLGVAGVTPAAAQLKTVINAVETAPSNIILPQSSSGMMTFRPCADECDKDHERVRVTPETKFSIDGSRVKWEDFRKQFTTIRQSDSSYALVSYETDTNVLISLEVSR